MSVEEKRLVEFLRSVNLITAEKAIQELGESIAPTVSRGQDTAHPEAAGLSGERSPARARGAPPERE